MNAKDWIESYVQEVAMQLPRKLRNDVAYELRALLEEELQAKAEDAGREPDVPMAAELLRAFGRPTEVAERYRPALTVVEPAEGRKFLRASATGMAILWLLGLVKVFSQPIDSGSDFLLALGQWWTRVALPSLWWPGALVLGFALAAWTRRRWPKSDEWKPRESARLDASRAGLVIGIVGILLGVSVLVDPRSWLETLFGAGIAPAALDALTYVESFRHRQGPILLVLLLLNVPLLSTVIVQGHWSSTLRRLQTALSVLTCAAMLWTVLDGPIFRTSASNQTSKAILVLIVVLTLLDLGVRWWRTVRPAPSRVVRA